MMALIAILVALLGSAAAVLASLWVALVVSLAVLALVTLAYGIRCAIDLVHHLCA